MTFFVEALLMFALAAFCGSRTYDDYRIGKMQLILKGISPLFDRIDDPLFFWGAAAFNTALTALFAVGGLILLLSIVLQR